MKRLLFIALICVATTTAFGQKEGSRIALGIKAGFNSTKFKISDLGNYTADDWKTETKNGFIYGAFARVKLAHPFYVQPEIYFSSKKFELGGESVSLKTFDVPILLNFRVLTLGPVKVHALAGPVASIVREDKMPSQYEQQLDFKKTNWTLQAGAGVEVLGINLDARYEWGLSDVSKGIDGRTNVLTITAGLRLFGR
ncbi:MAG: PorT family protein [Breznakibacter sp.]|nr:PorT family protein [Breznakibacter sp.]